MRVGNLPFTDYVDLAPEDGQQINVNHENCTAGADSRQRLYIRTEENRILAYCHNCGLGGVFFRRNLPRDKYTLQRELSQIKVVKGFPGPGVETPEIEVPNSTVSWPPDMIWDPDKFPAKAAAWLYKYRLTKDQIDQHYIGYSPSMGRVVLPVFNPESGCLVSYQARRINDDGGPKYITYSGSNKDALWIYTAVDDDTIVVVEDILSAIRVSEVQNAVALLGTHINDKVKTRLMVFKNVVLWLDNDMPGMLAATTIRKELNPYTNVRVITSAAQPKELSKEEIELVLTGGSGFTLST